MLKTEDMSACRKVCRVQEKGDHGKFFMHLRPGMQSIYKICVGQVMREPEGDAAGGQRIAGRAQLEALPAAPQPAQ
jgi:hypothetical protein